MSSLSTLVAVGFTGFCALFTSTHLSPPAAAPNGHLILQIEGDARGLRVTRVTVKTDPCGIKRLDSDVDVVVRDARGRELGRYALDLRMFDLDPARVGTPLRVEGCRIVETQVAMLANIPNWPTADRLEIVRGARVLGTVDAPTYAALLAGRTR